MKSASISGWFFKYCLLVSNPITIKAVARASASIQDSVKIVTPNKFVCNGTPVLGFMVCAYFIPVFLSTL